MPPVEIVGWVATFVSWMIGTSQFLHLWRTRNAEGLSVLYWQLNIGVVMAWCAHGILLGAWNVAICNSGIGIASLFVLWLLHETRKISYPQLLLPGLFVFASLLAVDLVAGSAAFGIPVSAIQLLSNSGQAISMVRSPSIAGVSGAFLVFLNLNQLAWGIWGWMAADSGMLTASAVTEAIVGFSLVWWVLRRLGVPAFFAYQKTEVAS
ncbi:MAG: hypothetical protein LBU38_02640 [Propionibacteriaceae bacterium]|jgi:uncharacterized protein with PQ loop repeat|nr:hypothetical protein [Propionibacteriaceae bacterium]